MENKEEKHLGAAANLEVGINPSGHRQELDRNFNFWTLFALAISSGNVWMALGGSVTVAIFNGGPPGVLYEFLTANFFYCFIAASLAELASAMPSAGGVYHWASITGGKYGRVTGWFAGWLNFWAWMFGLAAPTQIVGTQVVAMYRAFHPDYTTQRWHIFMGYFVCSWIMCLITLYLNRLLPKLAALSGVLMIVGLIVTILVCAVLPGFHDGYATSKFVWREWQNTTGYRSDGFVFLLGILNGAFGIGTPDIVTHLAEEVRRPSKAIPITICFQVLFGGISAFAYLIAIFYSISDLPTILESPYLFPLASIYQQATGSDAGTVGLLLCTFVPFLCATVGTFLITSRIFWTLARDNATPFAESFGRIHPKHKNPFNAIILCAIINTLLGCIYLGSAIAFNAFVGSFVILTCLSYLAAILPHLLGGRSGITPGWFWMKGRIGFVVNGVACAYIICFTVIFCFPFSVPVSAATMNYSSLMCGGMSLFVAMFWFWRQQDYGGPKYVPPTAEEMAVDAI